MSPHTAGVGRAARIAAGLIAAAFGAQFLAHPGSIGRLAGAALVVGGLTAAIYQASLALASRRPRRDRYDLSRLWDDAGGSCEPDPAAEEPDADLVYCHRCGAAMPQRYAFCPECGNKLGY